MEFKAEEQSQKPKEIPVPREISQLIGMGFKHQNSEAIAKITEDVERLGANPDFAGLANKIKIMTESVKKMINFLDNLEGKETKLVETRPDVYDSKFVGQKEELDLQPGKQIIDNPIVPQLLHAIFHTMRNSVFLISSQTETTALKNNKNAHGIRENCDKMGDFIYLFQNAKRIEVTIDENLQVNLMPVVESPKLPVTNST